MITDEQCLGLEFQFHRDLPAPRERIFQAWTAPHQVAQWWGPRGFSNPVCEWEARPGGKMFVVMRSPGGADYPMHGECREVTAPERFALVAGALDEAGQPIFDFLHTVTLTETAGRSQLVVHSRVIMAKPGAGQYITGFEAGMGMSLDRLAEYLAHPTEPLVVGHTLKAPTAVVWQALTDDGHLGRWSFDIEAFEPVPGFEFQFSAMKDEVTYVHRCQVKEVIPQKRLVYSWRYEGYAGDSRVSFDLLADGAQTRVRLTHTGLESFPPTPDFARENFLAGWTYLIDTALREYVEPAVKGPPPPAKTPPPAPAAPAAPAHPRDPLHGITLETILNHLVQKYGWLEMGRRIPVRCFNLNPTVKSSLTFLRKNEWARKKVEGWYISEM